MTKRANKITALLVAAASVISTVPAIASDSTTSRLGSKDGTIKNAVAFKDGKYAYQGYKSDDNDEAIYYNGGDKDKLLDNIEEAELNGAYEDKYAFVNDGSDQYLIDLTNGDLIDDDTPEDDINTAATKLKTKLKKTDRYGNDISVEASSLGYDDTTDNLTGALPGNKFGDTWYAYKIQKSSDTDASSNLVTENDGKQYLYGFTNGSGKYIDSSNIANIYAYSTLKGKMIKIEEFSNDKADVDNDSGLLATLIGQPVVLTQDKDYIYELVKVAITDTASDAILTGGTTTSAAAYTNIGDTDGKTTIRTYIQKISKEQGDQKDDAYLPKSVESYELGNIDGKEYDCSDATDAYDAIKDATGIDAKDLTQNDVLYTDKGKVKPIFSVVNGKLTVVKAETDNIKATTIFLKKDDKVKFDSEDNAPSYKGSKYDISNKVNVYLAEKDNDDDVDIDVDDKDQAYGAYDIDVDGNIWVVADAKIYKFVNNQMTKVYATDSSLNQISVYDENSMIAWEYDGNNYTNISEGKAQTESEAPAPTTTNSAKVGWDQLTDGTWNFYDSTGTKVANNWINVGGFWYYLKADGVMATGWINYNGSWYFLNSSGAMQTGWINDNGTWYYLYTDGAMALNTVIDGYKLSSTGSLI